MPRHAPDGRQIRARAHRRRRLATWVLVGVAALLGATATVSPAGVLVTDRLLAALAAAGLAVAGRRARRWTLCVPAVVGTVLAGGATGVACGIGALVVAIGAGWRRRRNNRLNVLAAALGAGALLRLGDLGFHGASALVAVAAAAPVVVSGWRHARPRTRRVVVRLGAALVGLAVVAAAGALVALLDARGDVARGQRALDRGVAAAREGDDVAASRALREATDAFGDAGDALDAWWAAAGKAVPVLGHNLRAVTVAADIAEVVGDAGADVLARAGADELAVQDGRVPVDAIAALAEPTRDALEAVVRGQRRASEAMSPWLLPMVGDRYDELTAELADVRPDLELAVDAVDTVPRLLGADGPRRYLVLFVTPVEARPTGFPGNYAELVVDDGRLDMTRFGRITDLELATPVQSRTLDMPAEYHQRYDRFRPARFFRNLTATPDFPTVAETVRQLYPQAGGAPLDGVLSVDPAAIAAILQLTGPVAVPELDEPLTAENAEQFLLRDQYVEFGDRPERVDTLETLGHAAFEQLTTGDLPGPTDIADVLAPVADAGHLRVVAFHPDGEAFLEAIGVTGALPPAEADTLAVTNVNSVGGKLDLFLERDIAYDVRWDPATGAVDATATVTLTNTTPTDAGLPDYVVTNALEGPGADLPLGTNRTYVSVFTPWSLEGATLGGEPLAMETHREQDRWVYSALVDVAPDGGTATLRLDLGGRFDGPYRLALWPQLLPHPDHVAVHVESTAPLSAPVGFTVDGSEAVAELDLAAPTTLALTSDLRPKA